MTVHRFQIHIIMSSKDRPLGSESFPGIINVTRSAIRMVDEWNSCFCSSLNSEPNLFSSRKSIDSALMHLNQFLTIELTFRPCVRRTFTFHILGRYLQSDSELSTYNSPSSSSTYLKSGALPVFDELLLQSMDGRGHQEVVVDDDIMTPLEEDSEEEEGEDDDTMPPLEVDSEGEEGEDDDTMNPLEEETEEEDGEDGDTMPPLEERSEEEEGEDDTMPPLEEEFKEDDDDTMPPLEGESKDEGEDVQGGHIPAEETVSGRTETEIPSVDDFLTPVFLCDFCGIMFRSEVSLIRHQNTRSHHCCFPCQRRFKNWVAYLQHLGDSIRHNFCFECEMDFPSPEALQSHLESYPHVTFCTCTTVVLVITVLVVLMGVAAAYWGGRLQY